MTGFKTEVLRQEVTMQGDFLIKVRAVYNQFTKAEKKVADYILQHPKDVLFMSITDLAEACNVGIPVCSVSARP